MFQYRIETHMEFMGKINLYDSSKLTNPELSYDTCLMDV